MNATLRHCITFAAAAVFACGARAATITVTDPGDLSLGTASLRAALDSIMQGADANAAIAAQRTGTYGVADTILFAPAITTVTVVGDLPVLRRDVTIDGRTGLTIDPNGSTRVFAVIDLRGTTPHPVAVTLANLTLRNGVAAGGSGGLAQFPGGGGLGAGGALYVHDLATVVLRNVALTANQARGGAGGNSVTAGPPFTAGGGGGMGGRGGDGIAVGNAATITGGGGGFGQTAEGGSPVSPESGRPGILVDAAGGGAGQDGKPGSPAAGGGGIGGRAGGTGYLPGAGGGGAGGGNGGTFDPFDPNGDGGHGGFGGGGGAGRSGGNGGFGGGAGGPVGGIGGFGGGSTACGTPGFAGGIGNGWQPPGCYVGGGGGGAGLGGAIFVMKGGNVRVEGVVSIQGNTVAGGAGGTAAQYPGGAGRGHGAGLFLHADPAVDAITFAPGAGESQTIADVIADMAGSGGSGAEALSAGLTLAGAGTLRLTAANTYTGTTHVRGGTLFIDGAQAASPVVVHAGGRLGGIGTAGAASVEVGGTLAPGSPAGTLQVASVSLVSGATFAVTAGASAGQRTGLRTGGTVALDGATLSVTVAGALAPGNVQTIVQNDGAGSVGGTFAGLPEGATFVAGGTLFRIGYAGGDGNDVTLTVLAAAATQTTIVSNTPNPVAAGSSVTVTASVQPVAASSFVPTGTIVVSDGQVSCTILLPASSCSLTPTTPGIRTLVAQYAGDGRFAPSTSPGVTQQVNLIVHDFTGSTATGSGTFTATFNGGGPLCTLASGAMLPPPPGASPVPPNAPSHETFPHGLFAFQLTGCDPGSAVTVTMTFPAPLPAGTRYWKYGRTPSLPYPHWYTMPASINGKTVQMTVQDGGLGDDDLAANGTIADPGGPAINDGGGQAVPVPALGWPAMLFLLAAILGLGAMRERRRRI